MNEQKFATQEPLQKTPVTVLTGFLGAGKTTLVRRLLTEFQGLRLAVIVNEFGDAGVDGDILKECAIENCPAENIVELPNGCICCTVAKDFIPTVEALLALDTPPEHILIETSGLALPKPLLTAFDWPSIRSRITVDGVVTLADAEAVAEGRFATNVAAVDAQREADESISHDTPLSELFEDQLACADIVLLTKVDLVEAEALNTARQTIENRSARQVPVLEVKNGEVDPRVILGLEAAAEDDIAARPSHHDGEHDHDHDDFESIVVQLPAVIDRSSLVASLEKLVREYSVLRVKGYVAVAGKTMPLLVQAVGPRVQANFVDPLGESGSEQTGRLVFIAEHDALNEAKIRATLLKLTEH